MNMPAQIVPRKGPYLGLEGEFPRHWFGGDPFRSRLFDALSLVFPEGEKFFITSVRDYRDEITDPKLAQEVKDFTYQEGQHSLVHRQYNDHLVAQGIDVASVDRRFQRVFGMLRKYFPRWFPLASTSAIEHFTATFSHAYLESAGRFTDMDERVRSMYAWHCVEEFEHKSVAFDVLQKVAKVGYLGRVGVMIWISLTFQFHIFTIMRRMLIADGFTLRQRYGIWKRGAAWLYGRGGMFRKFLPLYLDYLKPGYHPSQLRDPREYQAWVRAYQRSGNAIVAGNEALGLAAA